jgi:hypothetical protein
MWLECPKSGNQKREHIFMTLYEVIEMRETCATYRTDRHDEYGSSRNFITS